MQEYPINNNVSIYYSYNLLLIKQKNNIKILFFYKIYNGKNF